MFKKQNCYFDSCNCSAIPFSHPPSCSFHIQDIDSWFESLDGKLSTIDMDEDRKLLTLIISKDIYKNFFFKESNFIELYRDYKNKIDPNDKYQFLLDDIIYFILIAAASGIVGNFAYDAIKKLVHRIGNKTEKLDEKFKATINSEKYEELLKRCNHEGNPNIEIDIEFEIKIEKKYRLLIRNR